MSAKILPLRTAQHRKVKRLLPFEDMITGEERLMVQEHLSACPDCRSELAMLRKLKRRTQVRHVAPLRRLPHGWMAWMLAAQCAAIAALAGLLVLRAAAPAPAADAPQLAVVFWSGTSDRHVQAILEYSGARVVGGPTRAHAWLLRVPAGALERAYAELRAEPSVQLVTRLPAG